MRRVFVLAYVMVSLPLVAVLVSDMVRFRAEIRGRFYE